MAKTGKKHLKIKKEKTRSVIGNVEKTDSGFGFIVPFDGEKLFISESHMGGAMNGDLVEVKKYIRRFDGSVGAKVVQVVERSTQKIAGVFYKDDDIGYIEPLDNNIKDFLVIPKKYFSGAKDGDIVSGEILEYPRGYKPPHGKIINILAKKGDELGPILAVLEQNGISTAFSEKVLTEAEEIEKAGILEKDLKNRLDLRDEIIFTIDGDDSKDFDDAVSINILKNGNYSLGVHIADVTHYIKRDSHLDIEALNRGASIYLPGSVIPMIPEALSNGLCSLNPHVDRLCLSCIIEVDKTGNVVGNTIKETVIRSKARLTYSKVARLIDGSVTPHSFAEEFATLSEKEGWVKDSDKAEETARGVVKAIGNMVELYRILAKAREKRGAIDFNKAERFIEVDNSGMPVNIYPEVRNEAHKLIEEFMILANRVVAERVGKDKVPFIYRVHEKPSAEKIEVLHEFLVNHAMGNMLSGKNASKKPETYRKILDSVKGSGLEIPVSKKVLHSMAKAKYDTECLGHFGLALNYYCHFTSPIRRYPDLFIHSIIKECIACKELHKDNKYLTLRAKEAAITSTNMEMKGLGIERKVEDIMCALYMEDKIDEEYGGIVTGINKNNIFVTLPNSVEGKIDISYIDEDEYIFDENRDILVGKNSGKTIRPGDSLNIVVFDTDTVHGDIYFRPGKN